MSEHRSAVSAEQVTQYAPVTKQACVESAARVLRFAEAETNPMFADHLLSVASKWIELAETVD